MANMTEILEKYTKKLEEQKQLLLEFAINLDEFNIFFQGKTKYLPIQISPFLKNLGLFSDEVKDFALARLEINKEIEQADEKSIIMLRDIASLVEKIENLTKLGQKLNKEPEIFLGAAQILMNTYLVIKEKAERAQN